MPRSSPALWPLLWPAILFTSLQGQEQWRQPVPPPRQDRARRPPRALRSPELGAAAGRAPHRARCSTASTTLVPSLALVSQNRELWAWGEQRASVGSLPPWGPQGVPAHHGQLLPVGCADPRCLWQAGPQVRLVPHQHEWQWPLGGLREGRAAQGPVGLAASSRCCGPSSPGAAELCRTHRLPPVTPVPCLGAECGSGPNTNTSKREKLGGSAPAAPRGWPPTLLSKQLS